MEKNIAHPTDARLYDKARLQLVALADEAGVTLRQNYNRLAPRLAMQAGRYAHARQFKRMPDHLYRLGRRRPIGQNRSRPRSADQASPPT